MAYVGDAKNGTSARMETVVETDDQKEPNRMCCGGRKERNFVSNVGITGFTYMGEDGHFMWTRVLWLILLVLCFGMTAFQFYKQLKHWHDTPISTNFEVEILEELVFPSVTVCSSTKIRLTGAQGAMELFGIVPPPPPNNTDGSNVTSVTMITFDQIKSDLPINMVLDQIVPQQDDFILECNWQRDGPCRKSEIKKTNTNTGVCYTINHDPRDLKRAKDAGPEGALSLVLNIEDYEKFHVAGCKGKLSAKSHQAGAMVKVHSPLQVPMMETSIQVPAGFTHNLRVSPVRLDLIPVEEGGKCTQKQDLAHYDTDHQDEHYTSTCKMDSLLREIETKCDCLPFNAPRQPNGGKTFDNCSITQHFQCVDSFLFATLAPVKRRYPYKCLQGCRGTDYKVVQSLSSLPDSVLGLEIGQELNSAKLESKLAALANGSDPGPDCEGHLVSSTKAISMRRNYLRASNLKWIGDGRKQGPKAEIEMIVGHFRSAIEQMMAARFAPLDGHFMPAYQRLQNNSECFKTITTKHADFMANVAALSHQYPDAIALSDSPVLENIVQVADQFQIKVDRLAVANYLMVSMLQFAQLLQVYREDNYHKERIRSETLEQFLELFENKNLNKFDIYAAMKGNPRFELLTAELAGALKHRVEEDFALNLVKKLDNSSILTQQAIRYARSLNSGDPMKDLMLQAVFVGIKFDNKSAEEVHNFLRLLIDCSSNQLLPTATKILTEWETVYGQFRATYRKLLQQVLQVGQSFVWTRKFINENILAVNINFEDLQLQHIKQEKTYSLWSLLCDLGGTLGLFLGASILTLFDTLQILYTHCIKR